MKIKYIFHLLSPPTERNGAVVLITLVKFHFDFPMNGSWKITKTVL